MKIQQFPKNNKKSEKSWKTNAITLAGMMALHLQKECKSNVKNWYPSNPKIPDWSWLKLNIVHLNDNWKVYALKC